MYRKIMPGANMSKHVQPRITISIIVENYLLLIAARSDVIDGASKLKS